MPPSTYRNNAIPTCACGARLPEAPLLSPKAGVPVCAACHSKEMTEGAELAGAQSSPGEALRHLALSLTQPKLDPLLSRRGVCRSCGGVTAVESFRDHLEDYFIGRSYGHLCQSCGKRFRTETLWASFARSVGASLLVGLAWVFWFVSGPTNNVIAFLLAALALFFYGQRVQRIRNRWFSPRRSREERPRLSAREGDPR